MPTVPFINWAKYLRAAQPLSVSLVQSGCGKTKFLSPLTKVLGSAFVKYQDSSSVGVPLVGTLSNPATVIAAVSRIVVDTIKLVLISRRFAHIGKPSVKAVSPAVTNSDAFCPIFIKCAAFGVMASGNHKTPPRSQPVFALPKSCHGVLQLFRTPLYTNFFGGVP